MAELEPTTATQPHQSPNTALQQASLLPGPADTDHAVFPNGQSGVNYPTEKAPADAIYVGRSKP